MAVNVLISYPYCEVNVHIQGDQKVFVHLMITIHMSGAQRRFDHSV